jgi:hypothetical protein
MIEIDVRDYVLISKKDLQKVNDFTKDGFFMEAINENLLEAKVAYTSGFTQGCRYMVDDTRPDDDIDDAILFSYCTFKIQLP